MKGRTSDDAEIATTEIVAAADTTPLQAHEVLNEHANAIRAYARRTVHDIIETSCRGSNNNSRGARTRRSGSSLSMLCNAKFRTSRN
jgi:hypothetical protein